MDEARRFLPCRVPRSHRRRIWSYATSRERLFRSGAPPVSGWSPPSWHTGRGLSARPWHHRMARLARLALSPVGLLPRDGQCSARKLAGAACCRHRPRRQYHRHSAHLARSKAARQSAACRSAPRPWSSARQWCALRHAGASPAQAGDILAAGEGVETMLALKSVLPFSGHCRALGQPPRRPRSPPGAAPPLCRARQRRGRARSGIPADERLAAGIEIRELVPVYDDFNLDLYRLGPQGMRAHLEDQLVPSDRTRFCPIPAAPIPAVSPRVIPVSRRRAGRKKGFSFAATVCLSRKRAARAAFPSGDLPAAKPDCNGEGQLFSAAGLISNRYELEELRSARLCIAKQNSCPAPSSALLRPQAPTPRDRSRGTPGVQPVFAAGQGIAVKAAIGAA